MVKLAQHIDWPSQLPSKAGDGVTSSSRQHEKKIEQKFANGKPRKTLADLFEARATPSSSFSTTTTPPPLLSSSSSSTTSHSSPSAPSSLSSTALPSSSSSSLSACTATSTRTSTSSAASSLSSTSSSLMSSTTQVHVTFDDKRSAIHRKPAVHRSSEHAGSIKRSSSARKIADSSPHEGMHAHPSSTRSSKSGPLPMSEPFPRNTGTKTSSSEPSSRISPAKPSKGHSNENPVRSSSTSEQVQRTPLTNSEQRQRSPFRAYEHNNKDFMPKSTDSSGVLQNPSRFKQNESDPILGKTPDAEYTDKIQTVQGTPTKGKKSRRGLFALLADVGGTKQSGSEVSNSQMSVLRVSGNVGKSMGGKTGGYLSLPGKVSGNAGLGIKPLDAEMQDHQHLGGRMSDNLGYDEVGRESDRLTVEIPEKMVGLAWLGTEPRLLLSGTYSFPSVGFMLEQVVSERSSYVKHGMLHRVRIREGHLGVAWVDGKAVLLEAGVSVHMCPSNKFSYIMTDDKMISEKEFVLGPFRVVTVHDSEVGIKFCNRQPQILYSGRHCLSISKVEVFAGFESLLRRESNVREVSAMSNDNMKVSADIWVEWQIKAEDAAAARLANVTDVEGALCGKVRRAFNLVIWEVNAHDLNLQLTRNTENTNTESHPLLMTLSSNIQRESQDLFEEGWTMTIWNLQLRQLVISTEVKDVQG